MLCRSALVGGLIAAAAAAAPPAPAPASWGQAWLRYDPLPAFATLREPISSSSFTLNFSGICVETATAVVAPILNSSALELQRGLTGLLQRQTPPAVRVAADCSQSAGGTAEIFLVSAGQAPTTKQAEGFALSAVSCGAHPTSCTRISSASDRGVLYGAFGLLRRLQTNGTGVAAGDPPIIEAPATTLRVWNLWDNVDRSVERG
jgi:alpha-glucuronidase